MKITTGAADDEIYPTNELKKYEPVPVGIVGQEVGRRIADPPPALVNQLQQGCCSELLGDRTDATSVPARCGQARAQLRGRGAKCLI